MKPDLMIFRFQVNLVQVAVIKSGLGLIRFTFQVNGQPDLFRAVEASVPVLFIRNYVISHFRMTFFYKIIVSRQPDFTKPNITKKPMLLHETKNIAKVDSFCCLTISQALDR